MRQTLAACSLTMICPRDDFSEVFFADIRPGMPDNG